MWHFIRGLYMYFSVILINEVLVVLPKKKKIVLVSFFPFFFFLVFSKEQKKLKRVQVVEDKQSKNKGLETTSRKTNPSTNLKTQVF